MASTIFNSAQRIIAQIFSWTQTSSQDKTANLITDSFQTGVIAGELGEFLVTPGSNNTPVTPTISIGAGIAYDINANRVTIPTGDTTTYNASNPATTTADGIGGFVLTPLSTGCINIPMTQGSQNYVWIDYLAAIDPTVFTLNRETDAKQFYKQVDGYVITVTTVNIAPFSTSIYLANVNQTGGGSVVGSNISQVGRTYYEILSSLVPITTAQPGPNPVDRAPVYNAASSYTLEAHIKAVGTGTQSNTNPHATTLADLGISTFDTVISHRQLEHGDIYANTGGNAIIAGTVGNSYPSTSAMAASINIVNPGSDTLTIKQLLSSEFAIINGTAYNVNTIFGAVPSDAVIVFPTFSGTFNVYWSTTLLTFGISTSDISADPTKLWLCTVTWTYVGSGPFDHNFLSGLVERRRIGSTTEKYQRWVTTARPSNPLPGEYGFNFNINAPEYFDGTAWQSLTIPTGSMLDFAGLSAPVGFLQCDGSAISRTTYANLFAVIGIIWGSGDGSTTFNLPDFRRKTAVGSGGTGTATLGNTVGSTGGEETHTLTTPEIPAHNHPASSSVSDPGHRHNFFAGTTSSGGGLSDYNNSESNHYVGTNAIDLASTGISVSTSTSNTGGGGTHNNIQPSSVVTKIIKY